MNIPKEKIHKIVFKWLTQSATEEELKLLKQWGSENEDNLRFIENLQKIWKEETPEPILVNSEAKANEIWEKGMQSQEKKRFGKSLLKYAAVFLILLTGSLALFFVKYSEKDPIKNNLAEMPSYIFKENSAGQKTKIFLPDGSYAYLNSSSNMKYLAGFDSLERRIFIEGEAFFEVAKDPTKPFIVVSNGIETVALGTSFNVNAFDENQVKISLVEGSVKIYPTDNESMSSILSPGNELIVNPETQTFLEQAFDLEEAIGWKEGKLVFNHASLNEVVEKLERWYGVDIQVKGKIPTKWIVTTVYENQSLKNILTDLQYSKKFAYEIDKSNVTITF